MIERKTLLALNHLFYITIVSSTIMSPELIANIHFNSPKFYSEKISFCMTPLSPDSFIKSGVSPLPYFGINPLLSTTLQEDQVDHCSKEEREKEVEKSRMARPPRNG